MQNLIILDTNVLISALMYADSPSSHAVVSAFRYFQPIASHETWNELEEVSERKKFVRFYSNERRLEFLTTLAQAIKFIPLTVQVQACSDPKDDKFLSLALSAECKIIVSGDTDLTSMNPFQGINIIPPGVFLRLINTEGFSE